MNKTSKAQIKASTEWKKRNPEKTRYMRYKGSARTFVRHHATLEDFKELIEIFNNENPNAKKEG